MSEYDAHILEGETCPMCHQETLTLSETEREIPYFGMVYVFSMTCGNCKYHKADLEAKEHKPPVKWTLDITPDELDARVVKSAEATLKIPRMVAVESSPASNGYITNVEGVLNRIVKVIESARDNAEDPKERKQAKNHLKKLQKTLAGQEKLKLIIEDKSGNSAIISENAKKAKP